MLMTISYLLDSPLPLYLLPLYIHCIADLNSCFCSNGLCLNAVKLEATLFGAHQHLHSFPAVPSVNVASSTVTVSDKITPHGVIINKYFTLILIFLQFARNPFFHLRALRHMCSLLTEDRAGFIVTGMVLSHLDYANSLLFGCLAPNRAKLEYVQNKRCPYCFRHTASMPYPAFAVSFALAASITNHLTYKVLTHNQPLCLSHNSLYSCLYPCTLCLKDKCWLFVVFAQFSQS